MDIVIWLLVMFVALGVMLGGADMFLHGAEKIGLKFGLSSFTIGVFIVGLGTSLPELTSAFVAVFSNVPSFVTANAIGSNIANILLIGGVLAFLAKKMTIDHDLLDAELPFFVISTALFALSAMDGDISRNEAFLLAGTFVVYFMYLFSKDYKSGVSVEAVEEVVQHDRFSLMWFRHSEFKSFILLLVGLLGLLVGAKFVIDAVVVLAEMLSVSPGTISIAIVALGTSLPELVVSVRAIQNNKLSLAVGNIFGSNAFNILMAVGVPGLFMTLPLDAVTFTIGLPVMLVASTVLLVIGLAQKLYRWEGIMFLLLYAFFIMQLVSVTM